jgi:hypothetical protein
MTLVIEERSRNENRSELVITLRRVKPAEMSVLVA